MTKLFTRTRSMAAWLVAIACANAVLAQTPTQPEAAQVRELRFADFFQTPAGAKGTQLTSTLRDADGQTLRLTGYMVQQERPTPGRFMLTPRPVRMSEHADGDADDLPLNWVMVYLDPSQQDFVVPHVRGLIQVQGQLSVGRLEEQDGRVSWVRLQLEPQATRYMNTFEVANYLHTLQHLH